jgi:hypothetical protein
VKAKRPFAGWGRFLIFWVLFILAQMTAAVGGITPRPRTSAEGDVLTAILLVVCGIIPIVRYNRMSLGARICALLHSGLAFGLLWIMTFVTVLENRIGYFGRIDW